IGKRLYQFSAHQSIDEIDVSDLFEGRTGLADLSVVVEPCSDNDNKACAVVRKKNSNIRTWQAKFFSSVAGDLYIRQNEGEVAARILSDLMNIRKSAGVSEVSLFVIQNESSSCNSLAGLLDSLSLTSLGMLKVGSPQNATKSRLEASQLNTDKRFALIRFDREFGCAEIREVEVKNVAAPINMKHMRGSISFSQASPFDSTKIMVSLSNLKSLVGPYHVHQFPMPQRKTSEENLCHNDHVGGHWNPFDVDTRNPDYPKVPGATHDMYETGDLSGRHGSMAGQDNFNSTFTDWNLPLFGRNSIVGRSVVIHHPNSSRLLCGTVGYPGNVMTAVAVFKGPVVGRIMFNQLKSNPDSDLTLFLELSYGNSLSPATSNHNWHAHEYPISSEIDLDTDVCQSTKGHYNPFKVDTNDSNYYPNCNPDSPFACEVGDFSSKHMAISLTSLVGTVQTKFFFTDTTAGLSGITSVLGRSLVIHGANKASSRLSCANITALRSASAQTGPWFGAGSSHGKVQFSQSSNLEPTVIKVSLTDLQSAAGGYHVHILPLRKSSLDRDACSNENILGHFNPFSVNQSLSPPPATGS
ncbi:SOD5 dismutase, partial [Polyodon spathula]|nr:SOD5 dismutase [Polyodon spathula]